MKKSKSKISFALKSAGLAVWLAITIAITAVAVSWDGLLEGFLGTVGGSREASSSYKSAYDSADAKLSLKTVMEDAGFAVNPTLWEFYCASKIQRGAGSGAGNGNMEKQDWKIGEVPMSDYSPAVKNSYKNDYKNAAIVVISRCGGEGSDLPTNMDLYGGKADEHYLELDANEKALLEEVAGAGFEKIIVIANSSNALELGFVNDPKYKIDACLWLSGTGNNGIQALTGIFNGDVSPSGHLVDTDVYDNFSSPAMQNYGDFRFINSKLNDGNGTPAYSYLNYGESIYMGYRYYETRYEDYVLGQGNAGEYNYDSTVVYPFGHGLSYTEFTWSDFDVSVDGEEISVSVNVKNTGTEKGKEVVQIYAQSPYTKYDIDNKVEKSAVTLVGYGKTKLLDVNGEDTVTVNFEKKQFASYDYKEAKTYLLEASDDYYVTAAHDAHNAVNNILDMKGANAEKMTGKVNKGFTEKLTFAEKKYDDAVSGNKVINHFDDSIADDAEYLSRNDWSVLENNGLRNATGTQTGVSNSYVSGSEKRIYTKPTSDEIATRLLTKSWENSGNPKPRNSYSEQTVANGGNLKLQDMVGVDYDDPLWDQFIGQMKASELHDLFGRAGYQTKKIDSIDKINTYDYDGPNGIANYLNGKNPFGYCGELTLACTYNEDLALQFGEFIGEDGLKTQTTGWYAPGMNLHRTPFSGRNHEYYSEDPFLSGNVAFRTVKGVQSKGLYAYMKHFFVNDQEMNRGAIGNVSVWSTEQALRELYLVPFQMSVEKGNCRACMTAGPRIGTTNCYGSYALITEILRGEWDFKGMVITDYVMGIEAGYADQILAAGGDIILSTAGERLTSVKGNNSSLAELKRAAKNVCYVVANSAAVDVVMGFPVYKILLIVFDILSFGGIIACAYFLYFHKMVKEKLKKDKPVEEVRQSEEPLKE